MADLILFHHAQGVTEGISAFADQVRAAGHQVTVPDLYDGATFGSIAEGVDHAEKLGFENILDAGVGVAEEHPAEMVYAGFSLGALVAHKLAQTRPGALGALLYHHGDVPLTTFGESWPAGVDVQIHVNEEDPFCELDIVYDFVERASGQAQAELFVDPGSSHLFTDSSLPEYQPESAAQVLQRTLEFLQKRS